MDTRSQFLLLVATYLQAQAVGHRASYVWDNLKIARLIPDYFWIRGLQPGQSVEQLAFEFASWTHAPSHGRPEWLPLTSQEEAYNAGLEQLKRQPR